MSIDDIMELARLKGRVIALEAELESEKAAMEALMTTHCSRLLRAEREEVARLKAEVERLTFDPMSYLDDQGEWMPRHTHLAAVERLKAEVERLRKAGDWMYNSVILNSDMEMDKAMETWNAAKEGKQS